MNITIVNQTDEKINAAFKNLVAAFFISVFSMPIFAKGSDALCPSGQYFVRGHFRKGYVRSDGTVVRNTNVKSYCKLLTKGYEYSKDRFKKGFPLGWPRHQEKIGLWTEDQKQRVIDVLDELPDAILSNKVSGIYRLKKSKDYPNPACSADGVIVLYDSAFDTSRNLTNILSHELSHQNYSDLSETERQDYRRATGWHMELEPNGNMYWEGRKDGYIEEDGRNSHEEDYANNLEHFLYESDKLKAVTPSAYAWIKKHFGDSFKITKGKK